VAWLKFGSVPIALTGTCRSCCPYRRRYVPSGQSRNDDKPVIYLHSYIQTLITVHFTGLMKVTLEVRKNVNWTLEVSLNSFTQITICSHFLLFRNPSCAPSLPRWKRTASTRWPMPAKMTSRRCEAAASMYHCISNSWPVTAQCWAGDFSCLQIFLQKKRLGIQKEQLREDWRILHCEKLRGLYWWLRADIQEQHDLTELCVVQYMWRRKWMRTVLWWSNLKERDH